MLEPFLVRRVQERKLEKEQIVWSSGFEWRPRRTGAKKNVDDFKLEGKEFIELDNLLKVTGLCDSGGSAKTAIAEGRVTVDGRVESRRRCKLRPGQVVEFEGHTIVVK